ncbi:MAG: ArnT family glycosyltransferase [Aquihabitans sp.]
MDPRPAPRNTRGTASQGEAARQGKSGPATTRTSGAERTRTTAGSSTAKPPARRTVRTGRSTWQPAWLQHFFGRLGTLATKPTTRTGLLAIALVFVGLSANLLARTPSYYNIDETAHVGYLSTLAQGHLPEIETPIEVQQPDAGLASRLKGAPDDQKTVWTANHPPGAYLPAVPLVWITNALGYDSALPVTLRIAGIFAGLFAVGFAYLLGREVSDGDERAGLLTAAITVCIPTFTFASGTGLTDAASFAAGLAVTWMAVRMIRLGYTSHRTYWLAAFVTLAAFTRLTSAVIAVLTVLALTAFAKRDRLRFVATALLPATVLTGWWYFRIQRLYGDVAASDYLLTRMDENRGETFPISSALTGGARWDDIVHGLVMSAPPYRFMFTYGWFRLAKVAVIGSFVAVLVSPVVRYYRKPKRPPFSLRRLDDRETGKTGLCAAIVLAISVILPFLFMAQHLAGGGGRHSRYLLPMVPVVAAVLARGVWMLPPAAARWTRIGVVALGAFVSFQLVRYLKLPQFYSIVNQLWIQPLLSPWVATLAAALAIVGFAGLFWSIAADEDAVLLPAPAPASAKRTKPTARPKPSTRPGARPTGSGTERQPVSSRRPPPEPARPPKR